MPTSNKTALSRQVTFFVPYYFTLYFNFPHQPRRRLRAPGTKRRGVRCGQGCDALEREKKRWRKCHSVYCGRASTPTHRLVTASFMVRPRRPRAQAVRARQEGSSSASCGPFPFLASQVPRGSSGHSRKRRAFWRPSVSPPDYLTSSRGHTSIFSDDRLYLERISYAFWDPLFFLWGSSLDVLVICSSNRKSYKLSWSPSHLGVFHAFWQ